ncbi:hypothetical protein [Oceanobacillus picturae]|uniref:hypothetical protein n=1 Tax=Oceanobacillus picturae TaxID=171693 RepID=UPI000685F2FA
MLQIGNGLTSRSTQKAKRLGKSKKGLQVLGCTKIFTLPYFLWELTEYSLKTVELTVKDLGFPNGATMPQIFRQASELGLNLCPLELGPYLRLTYFDQPESDKKRDSQQGDAPSGSITIDSEIVSADDEFPKGFYLRNVKGELWLRGYIADDLHVWNSYDRFIFGETKHHD